MENAIGLIELTSIAKGYEVADALLKTAQVQMIFNRTICPGKFMVMIAGEMAAVSSSIEVGMEIGGETVVDSLLIPNVHSEVFPAISGTRVMVLNAGGGEVMLFTLGDRSFTPAITIPDRMPPVNRLAVFPIKGGTTLLWTTIRGDFVTQDVQTGEWKNLASTAASTGVPPAHVRGFALGGTALVEMADGTAYILDVDADTLTPVTFSG